MQKASSQLPPRRERVASVRSRSVKRFPLGGSFRHQRCRSWVRVRALEVPTKAFPRTGSYRFPDAAKTRSFHLHGTFGAVSVTFPRVADVYGLGTLPSTDNAPAQEAFSGWQDTGR